MRSAVSAEVNCVKQIGRSPPRELARSVRAPRAVLGNAPNLHCGFEVIEREDIGMFDRNRIAHLRVVRYTSPPVFWRVPQSIWRYRWISIWALLTLVRAWMFRTALLKQCARISTHPAANSLAGSTTSLLRATSKVPRDPRPAGSSLCCGEPPSDASAGDGDGVLTSMLTGLRQANTLARRLSIAKD